MNPLAEELTGSRHAGPCTLVILGATGDLTHRKLVPALTGLAQDGLLPSSFAVVGFARRDKSDGAFRRELGDGVGEHGRDGNGDAFASLADRIFYHRAEFEDLEGYARLKARLQQIDTTHGTRGNRLFYLATPPSAYPTVLEQLQRSGLSREENGRFARVIIEKPFGRDGATARQLNDQVAAGFAEGQVFRIDHYLGKETVQNILAMRFANHIFEPLWNEKYVDHVQLTVAESIGVENRGKYFEEAGILRDMIQNHLLQVMTLVAMEPPVSLAADDVRDEKVKVLRAVRSFRPDEVATATVRGQYGRGFVGATEVPGYREEKDVDPESVVETYAAVRLEVANWRWAKTPFYLRAGKHLPRRVTEVAIHFKRPPHRLFDAGGRAGMSDIGRIGEVDGIRDMDGIRGMAGSAGIGDKGDHGGGGRSLSRNVLLLRIQPDEGVSLRFGSKVPGPEMRLRDVRMDFHYGAAFGGRSPDAYERLLLDAMVGDPTLFARRDEVEEAWRIVDSIRAGWAAAGPGGPVPYAAGTWGPEEADALLRGARVWRRP